MSLESKYSKGNLGMYSKQLPMKTDYKFNFIGLPSGITSSSLVPTNDFLNATCQSITSEVFKTITNNLLTTSINGREAVFPGKRELKAVDVAFTFKDSDEKLHKYFSSISKLTAFNPTNTGLSKPELVFDKLIVTRLLRNRKPVNQYTFENGFLATVSREDEDFTSDIGGDGVINTLTVTFKFESYEWSI